MTILFYILSILGLVIVIVTIGYVISKKTINTLQKNRLNTGYNEEYIFKYFDDIKVPKIVVEKVIYHVRNLIKMTNFPVMPNDRLGNVYGLLDDDLDEFVVDITKEFGCDKMPDHELIKVYMPIITVEDLVKLIAYIYQQNCALHKLQK